MSRKSTCWLVGARPRDFSITPSQGKAAAAFSPNWEGVRGFLRHFSIGARLTAWYFAVLCCWRRWACSAREMPFAMRQSIRAAVERRAASASRRRPTVHVQLFSRQIAG